MSTEQIIQSWEKGIEPYHFKVRNPSPERPKTPTRQTTFPSLLVSEENKRRTHQKLSGV